MNKSNIPYKIKELSRVKAVEFYSLSKGSFTYEIKPGQVWSTHSSFQLPDNQQFKTDEPRLIVILQGEGKPDHKFDPITVAPLSIHVSMASEYDFMIRQGDGKAPLTFDFMIEIWNETPALKGQLSKFICSLSEAATENIGQLYWSRLVHAEIPQNLQKYTGMKIVAEDDPRRMFQEEEIAAISYLAKAATAALELQVEEQPVESRETESWLKFELKPLLGRLSDYLRNSKTPFIAAHAANYFGNEVDSWLIEESEKFVFELLNSRQQPYSIYLKIHKLEPNIIGHYCKISVKTKHKLFYSTFIILKEGTKAEVGRDAHFHSEDVESVEVEIKAK